MAIVYLISPPRREFTSELQTILEAGVDWFQYRRPKRNDAESYNELKTVKSLTDRLGIKLIVNNRPDLARAVNAEGVHLGENDLPVDAVKDSWPELFVGETKRSHQKFSSRADYYGVGPVFQSGTKELPMESCGWNGIRQAGEKTEKPIIAIGGLTPEKLKDYPEQVDGIAVVSGVWDQENPARQIRRFKEIISEEES